MNNARAERFPNQAWEVSAMPSVEFDRMANDELRLSILLTDEPRTEASGRAATPACNLFPKDP